MVTPACEPNGCFSIACWVTLLLTCSSMALPLGLLLPPHRWSWAAPLQLSLFQWQSTGSVTGKLMTTTLLHATVPLILGATIHACKWLQCSTANSQGFRTRGSASNAVFWARLTNQTSPWISYWYCKHFCTMWPPNLHPWWHYLTWQSSGYRI